MQVATCTCYYIVSMIDMNIHSVMYSHVLQLQQQKVYIYKLNIILVQVSDTFHMYMYIYYVWSNIAMCIKFLLHLEHWSI